MTWKDYLLIALGVAAVAGAGYYIKHKDDIEEVEGSIILDRDLGVADI